MKFNYEYRTSDNVRHTGVVAAATRDEAFAILKGRGIKPGKVVEAPGFFNKLFGKGKRWIVIGVLGAACLVLVAVWIATKEDLAVAHEVAREAQTIAVAFEDMTRRQVIGDVAVIEKGVRTGWSDVFPEEGERFLASFAVPGVPAALRNTSEAEIRKALERQIRPAEGDSLEARQIKCIVEGMKGELRRFIAGEKHTIVEYGKRLVSRQEQELAYYHRAKTEIESAAKSKMPEAQLMKLWEERNSQLRNIGVKLIPLPEE